MKRNLTENQSLIIEISKLTKVLEKQNSWKKRLSLGMVQGVGTAIGATVIAGMALYGLNAISHQIPWAEVIQNTINE